MGQGGNRPDQLEWMPWRVCSGRQADIGGSRLRIGWVLLIGGRGEAGPIDRGSIGAGCFEVSESFETDLAA